MRGLLLVTLLAAAPAAAQQEATPVMEGRVVRAGQALDTATVMLHRVAIDTAGEIDSVAVSPDGRFRFDLPTVPDPGGRGEVYFASVRHQGVLYFGTAIHRAAQLDSLYTIEVHDTAVVAAGGAELALGVRYLVVEPADGGWQITDLFQVENRGDRTLVPGEEGRTVWSHPLPGGIRDVQIGEADLPPDAMVYEDGVLRVAAPIPPGQRQFVVQYATDDLDLSIPLPEPVAQMELLVREPAPPLEVTGLSAAEPLQMEQGLIYRRYTGLEIASGSVVIVPGSPPGGLPTEALAAGLMLLMAVAGVWLYVRSRSPVAAPASVGTGQAAAPDRATVRRSLLVEVARIDDALEAGGLDESEVARLRGRRTTLVRRLQDMG